MSTVSRFSPLATPPPAAAPGPKTLGFAEAPQPRFLAGLRPDRRAPHGDLRQELWMLRTGSLSASTYEHPVVFSYDARSGHRRSCNKGCSTLFGQLETTPYRRTRRQVRRQGGGHGGHGGRK
jgi:hypothetical protein